MPINQRQQLTRIRTRWRTGNVSPCMTWPSNETEVATAVSDPFGQDVTHEEKLKDWKKRIRLGVNATTRFVADNREMHYSDGEFLSSTLCKSTNQLAYHQEIGSLGVGVWWFKDVPIAPSIVIDQSALTQAIQRAHSDARAKQGALKGATVLAELRDAIRGIRNPAGAFRRGIDDYAAAARRNCRKANGGRSLPRNQREMNSLSESRRGAIGRALSGTYLEHAFGWTPLLNDIGDAVIAGIRLSRRTPRARFRGYGVNDVSPNMTVETVTSNGYDIRWHVSTYERHSVVIYGAVKLTTHALPLERAEEFGVLPKDFLPAVWEAIPYSFLVDYFTNVGEIVNALSFPRGDIAWVARTFRNSRIRDCTRATIRNSGGVTETTFIKRELLRRVPSTCYWSRSMVDRISYDASLPLPSFQIEIPGSKNWRKWLNMGALGLARVLS